MFKFEVSEYFQKYENITSSLIDMYYNRTFRKPLLFQTINSYREILSINYYTVMPIPLAYLPIVSFFLTVLVSLQYFKFFFSTFNLLLLMCFSLF